MYRPLWCQRLLATLVLTMVGWWGLAPQSLWAQDGSVPNETPTAETPSIHNQIDRNGAFLRQAPGALDAYRSVPFVPGELLVGFQHGDTTVLERMAGEVSAAAVHRLDLRGIDGGTGEGEIVGYVIQVLEGEEWATMERLLQDPSVLFATPNWLVQAATQVTTPAKIPTDIADTESDDTDDTVDTALAAPETPFAINDPRYDEEQWYLQRINASRAWSLAYGDEGFGGGFVDVQIAIVDSGIDVSHPEFRGRLLSGQNYVSPGEPPDDDYGHGTHVAGLIGAVANNATGIAGVAPRVRIDPRKVLNSVGSGSIVDVAAAIRDATDDGADIINLSLETSAPNVVMEAAVEYAFNRGVLLIAATGNSGFPTVSWPAAYSEAMAIASTTYNDRRASYSNAGPEVEIAAPGGERNQSMLSTWPGGVRCRDINAAPAQSDYCTSEGTSMAAAVASGAAAMIKSLRPGLSMAQIRQLLRDTAYPVGEPSNFVGSGRLDLQAALREIVPSTLQLSTTSFARELLLGADPYMVTLRLDNPSKTDVDWRAELIAGENFVQLNDSISNTITSSVNYGAPVYLTLTISPTHLVTGSHGATLKIDTLQSNNTRLAQFVDLSVVMQPPRDLLYIYLPVIIQGDLTTVASGYNWETPLAVDDRVIHNMTNVNDISLALPFTFTLSGRDYTDARLYADGFLRFPDTDIGGSLSSHCLPDGTEQPAQAIYGWWSELNPGAQSARVSTFQSAAGRFVVEFDSVPSAGNSPDYQVSFQIVLYQNGDISLNYREALGLTANAPNVTIGVKARDGLFFNQVACKDNSMEIGFLPESQQSLFFAAERDIY